MKKKIITFTLLGLLAVGSVVPMVAKASESWDYGYSQGRMQWYNYYFHSDLRHYGTITKNRVTYYGPTAGPGSWSYLDLDYNGPYAATYDRYAFF